MWRPFGSLAPSGARHVGYCPPNGLITLAAYAASGPDDTPNSRRPSGPRPRPIDSHRDGGGAVVGAPCRSSDRSPMITAHCSVRVVCAGWPTEWANRANGCGSTGRHPPGRIAQPGPAAMAARAATSESSQPMRGGSARSAQPGPAAKVRNRGLVRGSERNASTSAAPACCAHSTTTEGAVRRTAAARAATGRFGPERPAGHAAVGQRGRQRGHRQHVLLPGHPGQQHRAGRHRAGALAAYCPNTPATHSLSRCSISTPVPVCRQRSEIGVQHRTDHIVPGRLDADGRDRLVEQGTHRHRVQHERRPGQARAPGARRRAARSATPPSSTCGSASEAVVGANRRFQRPAHNGGGDRLPGWATGRRWRTGPRRPARRRGPGPAASAPAGRRRRPSSAGAGPGCARRGRCRSAGPRCAGWPERPRAGGRRRPR